MDERQFDVIARDIGAARSRRGALRAAMGFALGAVAAGIARPAEDAAAKKDACQVRCGADMRLCRGDCRIKSGASERQCKRTCKAWRERCYEHCEFKPLGKRTVPHDRGAAEFRRRRVLGPTRGASGVSRRTNG